MTYFIMAHATFSIFLWVAFSVVLSPIIGAICFWKFDDGDDK